MSIRASRRGPVGHLPILASLSLLLAGCQEVLEPRPVPAADAPFGCGLPATALAQLPRSPEGGEALLVDIEGVVSASFIGGLGGFYIQSLPATSGATSGPGGGAFIPWQRPGERPGLGSIVRVRGLWTPSEDGRSGWRLEPVQQLARCGRTAVPEPVPVQQPPHDWAVYEGIRVHLPGPLTVTGNDGLLRYGELLLSFGGRQSVPTQLVPPGAAVRERVPAKQRRQLVLDDARNSQYPQTLWHLPQAPGPDAPWRVGTRLEDVEGVIEYRHGSWRLQPTRAIGHAVQAPRPPAPPRAGVRLRVASFNLLNFFNGDGRGGRFPTARGAETPQALERQRRKLVAAMTALEADIIGVMELENDGQGRHSAVADLARALSRPGQPWQPVIAGARLGRDAIAVGLVYNAARVRPHGKPRTLEGGPFGDASRVPLAQAFMPIPDGEPFTVVVNHFKSKGGCDQARGADTDQGDGQACYNQTRIDSARQLHEWLQASAGAARTGQVLILGDLNAYAQEEPVQLLQRAGYRDLLADRPDAHTYVFRGQAGRLDHALASAGLFPRVQAAGVWHINADELPGFAFDGHARGGPDLYAPDPWRSSDHDPVWVDLGW